MIPGLSPDRGRDIIARGLRSIGPTAPTPPDRCGNQPGFPVAKHMSVRI